MSILTELIIGSAAVISFALVIPFYGGQRISEMERLAKLIEMYKSIPDLTVVG
jgi:hypothetical protein